MSAKMHGRPNHPAAFTLIELLVVVAIIALLISILLPSLSRARETARMVQCASVMKQYANGNEMYADSQSQFYVPIKEPQPSGQPLVSWGSNKGFRDIMGVPGTQHATIPTVASGRWPQAMQCSSRDQRYYTTQQWGLGYGFNYYEADKAPFSQTYALGYVFHRAKIALPGMKVHNIESNYWRQTLGGANPVGRWDTYGEEVISGTSITFPNVAYRHMQQVNIQYYDGHVSIATQSETYPTGSTNRRRLWSAGFK